MKKRDVNAPDGVVAYGERLVRRGGVIKFAADKFQDDRLLPFVGKFVGVHADEYWITHPMIYWPTYPQGDLLFYVGQPGERTRYKSVVEEFEEERKNADLLDKLLEDNS